ncbi:MAG: hypothetical protein RL134_1658 [Actinomycetota bacterium]|jgi:hydrogenase nickel incorporation protein HypA/HybF
MHELSVAHAIVSTVVEALPEDAPRVLEVRVRIGVLSGVVPDALAYAYDVAAQGTPLADAALHIERAPVVIHCPRCDADRTLATTTDFTCPECGTPSADVVDGKDMEILSIVLDDEPAVIA